MEDVIFGGTEQRKAHSWCEVSLLFDNEDRALSMDCAEVLVTRRVWRSGESEYYLNKAACRLRDINELFRDTGIGKDGYSLIGQGRIDEILSTKSENRREIFEEAAGIVTYRARKDEAERRMANTRQNLSRVEDILSELEGQLEPLSQQADAARRYLALRDTLRDLELNAFLLHHDRLKAQTADGEKLIAALDEQLAEGEPQTRALTDRRDELAAAIDALDEDERDENARVLEAARALEAREGQNNVLRERIAHAEADARRESALAEEEMGRADALEKLRAENQADQAAREAALQTARADLAAAEARLNAAQQEAVAQENALEAHKAAIMQAMNRAADRRNAEGRLTGLRQSLAGRLEEAERAAAAMGAGRTALEEAVQIAEAALQTAKSERAALETEAHTLEAAVRAGAQEAETLQQQMRDATAQRHETASRLKVLREMERDYEGYQHAVRQALVHARGDARVRGVVANILKSPKEIERALEMVLGSALQQIITEDEHAAKHLIEYLRENRLGRATFLPMTTVRGRTLNPQERQALTLPGCIGVASELVTFEEPYRGIVESLLGRTVIARDLDSGIEIMRRGRHAFRLVTLGGDVMHSGGSMTGGSVQSRMTSLLSREREIGEHAAKLQSLEKRLKDLQAQLEALEARRADDKKARNALFDRAHQAEIAVARDTARLESANAELAAYDSRRADADGLVSQIRDNLADVDEQLRRAQAVEAGGALDQADMHAKTPALQAALAAAREALEALREETTALRVSAAAQEREWEAVRREGERLRREEGQLSERQAQRGLTQQQQAALLEGDRAALTEGEAMREGLTLALEERRQAHTALTQRRQALQGEGRALETQLEEMRATLTLAADRRHRAELALVRQQGELKNLQDRIWTEYELTYAGAEAFRQENFDLRASEKQIAALRGEIREMGSVNVSAVEQYILTKERFEQLSTQRDDLLHAAADLEAIIGELLVKMERRFRKQFAQLNEYFGKAFALLFGGGQAELKLADAGDVLNCGIDIVVQPPGKKLQLLSLFSGGERALTAIAILFAMLQLKPTPFCILDEIEAALDEANVANFAEYLKRFSERIQFVVVTHRRGTMERCQALYGVAMEEKGVSRMVSVKLADAGA
jgi:chromosome segregation protein